VLSNTFLNTNVQEFPRILKRKHLSLIFERFSSIFRGSRANWHWKTEETRRNPKHESGGLRPSPAKLQSHINCRACIRSSIPLVQSLSKCLTLSFGSPIIPAVFGSSPCRQVVCVQVEGADCENRGKGLLGF
jgi:hypothetical protein